MPIDVEQMLKEVSSDEPAGPNLEHDSDFLELSREVDLRHTGGNPVNWSQVKKGSLNLLKRTKHLRLSIWLARALIHTNGWLGFIRALQFINGLITSYWQDVHPQLDPNDHNDPIMRINILMALCNYQETLVLLLDAPIVQSKQVGQFSLRDCKIARGEMEPPKGSDKEPIEPSLIAAAFKSSESEQLSHMAEALKETSSVVKELSEQLVQKVGASNTLDFSPLNKIIQDAQKVFNEYRAENTSAAIEAPAIQSDAVAPVAPIATDEGVIASREDAARMMDKICEYYLKHEPSSPIPLLMQRAKKLSTLSFLEILKDLAPDGLKQAQSASGAMLEAKK